MRLIQEEISKIKLLHEKSFHTNFSALIRDTLLEKRKEVDVNNINIKKLLFQVDAIQKQCASISRIKGINTKLKSEINEIKTHLADIKLQISYLKKTELYLSDIRVIEEKEKYDEWGYFFSFK